MAETIIKICTTRLVILKWLQMLGCIIVVLFLIDGRLQWVPYTTIFITTTVLGLLSFLTMIVYFLQIHRYRENEWTKFEMAFNFAASAFCFVYALLLVYDSVKMHSNEFGHHRYLPPPYIMKEGWMNRILVVMCVLIANSIFYAISFVRAYRRCQK